jgi:hypothetical protein
MRSANVSVRFPRIADAAQDVALPKAMSFCGPRTAGWLRGTLIAEEGANGIAQTATSASKISVLRIICALVEEFCFFMVFSPVIREGVEVERSSPIATPAGRFREAVHGWEPRF